MGSKTPGILLLNNKIIFTCCKLCCISDYRTVAMFVCMYCIIVCIVLLYALYQHFYNKPSSLLIGNY